MLENRPGAVVVVADEVDSAEFVDVAGSGTQHLPAESIHPVERARLEGRSLPDFAKLVIRLCRRVDRTFAVATVSLGIVAVDTGKATRRDDLQAKTRPTVLDCIFLAYARAWKLEKQLSLD
jgi:hypothetical protein